ncbi:ADI_G0038330.mRNA.1.CDS.1 [Saccharomyces cerevisiae]|uniref:YKR039Wp-like protein n=1 Tax=Saccharomyces cerevisiae (strain AWRI1631) TaxID=545124 RepID=B5VMI7_YEAS6|nr:Gap1p [Saccharomyces cerevisiae YJM993]AJS30270.1 Gap1p [Saccharomyces cerevisiae YJM189]AJS30571.1 Gap1p [Saccharomyces cerevisiae YJM193]AJS31170.1 Gap1p [Saccharomyces cerevisiae YJM244]AJS36810.1 Gap1p [Saccharomyces cerevisiae YJM689]AJS37393.1 Gap1p [Saccharomyces cerevisiae YJM969]AJS37695.1 Gap1p [Saccharomyces cerevisiae YJM972]AJS37998.1 Gap1p [Saccharomyces cerevisiae YJM975]AJS38299.1 Gap1p [Saccharomyces cerevisiae YJM978]AJS38601.1 Gap1p [Saccharomyces cerevisiae YJM981]A
MSNTSSYEKNNPDNLKHNGITIDSEFLTQEPITIPSNGSAVSIDETGSGSKWQDFKDSFKRVKPIEVDPNLSEAEKVAIITAQTPLKHHLKNRHLQMIAIGGAIGTGLLVGSGTALRTGGPASLMIGWGSTGTMIYAMVMALGELAVIFPISGGFTTYATRFIDESFGYANNFNYMLQWLVTLPLEIVSASITVNFWGTDPKYRDGFVALFWLAIVIINMFGVKGYGEAEFVFSFIKVITIVGFIILGIILNCGGGPTGGYIGGKYWHDPGAFAGDTPGAKFKGVCSVFVTAAFSFAGSELVGLAASESVEPRKSVPKAAKQVFWRITLFYILSLLMIGLLVPYNDKSLIGASSVDAAASPFVIAIKTHGIKGLPSVVNVVILIAVLSVGNSAIYGCSRTMVALAEQRFLPEIFSYVDRKGRPLVGIAVTSAFGLIAFVAASKKEGEVFNWLLALSGLSSLFTWGGICICHIRFRKALAAQGRGLDELSFKSPTGVWGSYWGLFMVIIMFIAQFYVALFPVGDSPSAEGFFEAYLSFPLVMVMYIGHKIYKRNWKLFIPAEKMDIDTGRREVDLDLLKQEIAEEKAIMATKPRWYRIWNFWC